MPWSWTCLGWDGQHIWRPTGQLEMQVSNTREWRGQDPKTDPTLGIAWCSKGWSVKPRIEPQECLHSRLVLLGFSRDGQRRQTVKNCITNVREGKPLEGFKVLSLQPDLIADNDVVWRLGLAPSSISYLCCVLEQVYIISQASASLYVKMRIT